MISVRRRKQARFASFLGLLLAKATSLKLPIVILEYYRDLDTQRKLFERGASKTMNSKHLEGLAVDIAFLDDIEDDGSINWHADRYKPLGEYWESLSPQCVWGGRFGDNPATETVEGWDSGHFEYRG